MNYAHAGRSPLSYRPNGGKANLLETDGVQFGVLIESLFTDQSLIFRACDLLVEFKSRLIEARNKDKVLFGHE